MSRSGPEVCEERECEDCLYFRATNGWGNLFLGSPGVCEHHTVMAEFPALWGDGAPVRAARKHREYCGPDGKFWELKRWTRPVGNVRTRF